LGADVVIGTHPHVPQGYEKEGDSLIFYSLGNFYFDSKNYKDKEDCSFAVWLKLTHGKSPEFKPVFHYKKEGLVHLAPTQKKVDLDGLCVSLRDGYQEAHDQMSLESYQQFKRNLIFSLMPIPYDGKLQSSLRRIASKFLGRYKEIDKTLLQLHLLRNEAYYYAAKHALEIQAKKRHTRL
jgi:poly-gamma-glutamate synthesis protein (capsule biosynthesis protein)